MNLNTFESNKAAEQMAKEHAISFVNWLSNEGYYHIDGGIWKTLKENTNTTWDTEDLYNEFIKQSLNHD